MGIEEMDPRARELAVDAVVRGDFEFASELLLETIIQRLQKVHGWTREQAIAFMAENAEAKEALNGHDLNSRKGQKG